MCKTIICCLLFVGSFYTCEAQPFEIKGYESSESNEYFARRSKYFESIDLGLPTDEDVLNYSSPYFEFVDCKNFIPYADSLRSAPYRDSISHLFMTDTIIFIEPEYIGKINKYYILKYEKKDDIEAFVFESSEFEDLFSYGIWIAYSENAGKNWNYYYTGIVQRKPVYVKWNSLAPLIVGKKKVQIDGALLKQTKHLALPSGLPEFEIVKDGISIVFNIDILSKDSDNDGLTDAVEDKFFTDKHNKDTDNDGITDKLDSNPRKSNPRTELSKVYEAIIDNNIKWGKKGFDDMGDRSSSHEGTGKLIFNDKIYYLGDTTETFLIITDNKDLMGIQPKTKRVLIVTEEEYKNNQTVFGTMLERFTISPLLKLDKIKNAYLIDIWQDTAGYTYFVKKTKKRVENKIGRLYSDISFMLAGIKDTIDSHRKI